MNINRRFEGQRDMYIHNPQTDKVTKKKLAAKLGIGTKQIQQFGSKQLFIVTTENGQSLYSYYRKVGVKTQGCYDRWILTTVKYSLTTSTQIAWFASQDYITTIGYGDI